MARAIAEGETLGDDRRAGGPRWRTALVTGASSGIGLELARGLARRGSDLVIAARREDRLEELADELTGAYAIDVEVIAADLTDPEERGRVEHRIRDVAPPIDLLVNNAGFGTYGPFVRQDVDSETAEIELNVLAPLRLMHLALPGMVERGHGAVLNVSSTAGFQPLPYNATYSSTKAFLTRLTEAVSEEVRGEGVRVMALCPGFVRTEFQERAEIDEGVIPSPAFMDPVTIAETGLEALAGSSTVISVPGLMYKGAALVSRFTPRPVRRRLIGAVMRRM
jgi:uncharacterized protein